MGVMNEKAPVPSEIPNELVRKMSQWRQANPQATLTEIEEAVAVSYTHLDVYKRQTEVSSHTHSSTSQTYHC